MNKIAVRNLHPGMTLTSGEVVLTTPVRLTSTPVNKRWLIIKTVEGKEKAVQWNAGTLIRVQD